MHLKFGLTSLHAQASRFVSCASVNNQSITTTFLFSPGFSVE